MAKKKRRRLRPGPRRTARKGEEKGPTRFTIYCPQTGIRHSPVASPVQWGKSEKPYVDCVVCKSRTFLRGWKRTDGYTFEQIKEMPDVAVFHLE